jgi:hypothetical protein
MMGEGEGGSGGCLSPYHASTFTKLKSWYYKIMFEAHYINTVITMLASKNLLCSTRGRANRQGNWHGGVCSRSSS